MNNILEKHISRTQKRLKKYCNLILKSKYDKDVSEELIQTYIEARYYNYGVDTKTRVFYRRIFDAVKKKSEKLIEKEPDKQEVIEYTLSLFQYFFYFDFVRRNIQIDDVVDKITEKRIEKFNLRSAESDGFDEGFKKLVKEEIEEIEFSFDVYDSSDFKLDFVKLDSKGMYNRVNLLYDFVFPEIFSQDAITETYNTDIIAEDKLFVEYSMIAMQVLKDVLDGNFKKVYIVDFAVSLFSKAKKLHQLLEILENQAAQDKIYFEISYGEFKENKNDIYKMMKLGFKFSLKTHKNMPKLTDEEMNMLDVFTCVRVDANDVNKNNYKRIVTLDM